MCLCVGVDVELLLFEMTLASCLISQKLIVAKQCWSFLLANDRQKKNTNMKLRWVFARVQRKTKVLMHIPFYCAFCFIIVHLIFHFHLLLCSSALWAIIFGPLFRCLPNFLFCFVFGRFVVDFVVGVTACKICAFVRAPLERNIRWVTSSFSYWKDIFVVTLSGNGKFYCKYHRGQLLYWWWINLAEISAYIIHVYICI